MIYILIIILIVIVGAGLYLFHQSTKRQLDELKALQRDDQAVKLVTQWLESTRGSMDSQRQVLDARLSEVDAKLGRTMESMSQRLDSNTKTMGERLDNAARVIGVVQQQLGTLAKTAENMQEIGKDISSLQDILRAPKLRGGLGEYFLADLLGQILPAHHFELQYGFRNGEIVDAVVKLSGKMVCVDAKFPLENFRKMVATQAEDERKKWRREFVKDVRKHVDAIAKKYIMPDQGTFDFALMYIPAENVYYETIIKDENFGEDKSIATYAIEQHVIPVSPNSFYAYLQAIILGLRGMRVEERAQEIIDSLAQLRGDLVRFRDDFEKLGGHITNAQKKYDEAEKRLVRFEDKLENASGKQLEQGGRAALDAQDGGQA
ncbi:MAG TPA: DNA recombination protein RmuC [Candidatus Edwardsbacteria bacterium]|nr:DNA recombination protein RmuC [Candidatus Edwardsbacteria bacterium]